MTTFVAYDIEKKVSKHPERFGKGAIEGVAAPESANNATSSAGFIPLMSLGVPCSPPLAVLLGGLMIYGLQPGPLLFDKDPQFVWAIIASMYIGNIMLLVLNLPLVGMWVKLTKIPFGVMAPIILMLSIVGAYTVRNSMFDVGVALVFGILGYVLRKFQWPVVPLLLSFILGPLLEKSLIQSLSISGGNPLIFFQRGISLTLIIASVILFVVSLLQEVHTSSSMMIGAFANPPVALPDRKYAGRIIMDPFVFAVKSDAPWKNFKEFTEWVKANPTELIYGTVGPGGPSRFAVCDWLQQNGVDPAKAKMVVTEGGSDSMTKLAGGHINLAVHTVAESYALAEAGKVKVLAVLADQRSPFMPNAPTAKEQGVIKDVNVRWWGAIALPSGVPDAVLKKWESAVADLVKDPDFMAKAKNLHLNIDYLNTADTTAFVQKEGIMILAAGCEKGVGGEAWRRLLLKSPGEINELYRTSDFSVPLMKANDLVNFTKRAALWLVCPGIDPGRPAPDPGPVFCHRVRGTGRGQR